MMHWWQSGADEQSCLKSWKNIFKTLECKRKNASEATALLSSCLPTRTSPKSMPEMVRMKAARLWLLGSCIHMRALDHRRWGISTPSFTRSLLYLRVHACARSCTMHMRDQSSKQCLTGVWRVFPHAVHLWAPISYRKLSTIFLATDEDVLMETPRPSETSCSSTGPVKLRRFGIMIPVCLPITDDLYHLRHMLYIYS